MPVLNKTPPSLGEFETVRVDSVVRWIGYLLPITSPFHAKLMNIALRSDAHGLNQRIQLVDRGSKRLGRCGI